MALVIKSDHKKTDKNLEPMTESEALRYQLETLLEWRPKSDVWPFRYSMGILAGCAGFTGWYLNHHYRTKLKLHNLVRISTYMPIVVLPALVSAFYHQQFIMSDVLLSKTPCPVCVEMRATAFQIGIGVIYPTILAPLAVFTFASRLHTYNIPFLNSADGRARIVKLWRKTTRPLIIPLLISTALQGVIASQLTAAEYSSVATVREKMGIMEGIEGDHERYEQQEDED